MLVSFKHFTTNISIKIPTIKAKLMLVFYFEEIIRRVAILDILLFHTMKFNEFLILIKISTKIFIFYRREYFTCNITMYLDTSINEVHIL